MHQQWQVDFKVGIRLQDGPRVNLHTVRDPVGQAVIGAFVFATGHRPRRVTAAEVRAVLWRCFARWGTFPEEVQTDGEPVLVNPTQDPFPSVFTPWLKGLDIDHRVIHNVTSNAAVERAHRTITDYAVVGNEDHGPAALQPILDQATDDLNFELPSRARHCDGQPPILAHPELLHPHRPFQPDQELARFDLKRVDAYLATFTWHRMADKNGRVSLGGKHRRYSPGRASAGWAIVARCDPRDRHFVFAEAEAPGTIIRRLPAKGLDVIE